MTRRSTCQHRPRRTLGRFEALESRNLLSANPLELNVWVADNELWIETPGDVGGSTSIYGDADSVTVAYRGTDGRRDLRTITGEAIEHVHWLGSDFDDRCLNNAALPSTLVGQGGRDILIGGQFADAIFGGADDDLLYGRGGDDALHGEEGNDRMYGGPGADGFYSGSGLDVANQSAEDQQVEPLVGPPGVQKPDDVPEAISMVAIAPAGPAVCEEPDDPQPATPEIEETEPLPLFAGRPASTAEPFGPLSVLAVDQLMGELV